MTYVYDEGHRTADGFEADHRRYLLRDTWVRAAQQLSAAAMPSYGELSAQDATRWLLERLLAGEEPRDHPARRRCFPGETWQRRLTELEAEGMLVRTGHRPELTAAGRAFVERALYDGVSAPGTLPFAIHVGPIASGNVVVKDGVTWDQLGRSGVRSVLGLEMEAAAVAATAHRLDVPAWLVVKGVTDHADPRKDDRHKWFAATASAEVMLSLLASQMGQERAPVAQPSNSLGREVARPQPGLVDLLLAVPGMSEPTFRQRVYDGLPEQVMHQIHRDSRARVELIGLVDTFNQYGHLRPWQGLLTRLDVLLPEHPAVQRLSAYLRDP